MQHNVFRAAAFAAAFALSATVSFYANAADLGGYGPKYNPPPPQPAYSKPVDYSQWAGWYFGGVLGYGWGDVDINGGAGGSAEPDGIVGGGLLGWNYQAGRLVIGLEGDILASSLDGSRTFGANTVDASLDWTSALRVRAGVSLTPELLVFATLGAAWADFDLPLAGAGGGTGSEIFSGLQYGAGAEVKLTGNWSARFDYLYTDFDSETLTYSGGTSTTYDPDIHQLRGSVVYRF